MFYSFKDAYGVLCINGINSLYKFSSLHNNEHIFIYKGNRKSKSYAVLHLALVQL